MGGGAEAGAGGVWVCSQTTVGFEGVGPHKKIFRL